jgi:hypothetical protein
MSRSAEGGARRVAGFSSRADAQYKIAVVYELCGDRGAAISYLAKAVDLGYAPREIDADPELVALRRDPRYQSVVRK